MTNPSICQGFLLFSSIAASRLPQPQIGAVGPLEATIASISHEISNKEEQSRDMQRQWLVKERELIVIQDANSQASQELQRLRGQHVILGQRRLSVCRRYLHGLKFDLPRQNLGEPFCFYASTW